MSLPRLLDHFRPGRKIYLPGATGEILALASALEADPARMAGVNVIGCPLPGMNTFDYAALADDARQTAFLFPPASRESFAQGRVQVVPLSYFGAARYLAQNAGLDVALVHLAPPLPGEGRKASVGIAADFTSIAWNAAKTRIAVVNPTMPAMKSGPRIDLDDADLIVDYDSPLVELGPIEPDAVGQAIANRVAELIPDGAALQVGIGSAPAALWKALESRRGLRLRSGLASEHLLHLADKGALAETGHIAGILAGSSEFYREMAERSFIRLADTFETHDARAIGMEPNFFAANSALSVDLFGQVNLEWQGISISSGVGGAPDFACAAFASPGGSTITMLPSTARRGSISRIVVQLNTPTVSLPRSLADIVATEHGVAHLRNLSMDDRAEALIAIADPQFRDDLSEQWRAVRNSLS